MRFRCPVCMYGSLPYPARDYHICPCCGTEFGNDDAEFSHAQLREMWVADGAFWFFGIPPRDWNPWLQLIEGGHPESAPAVRLELTSRVGPRPQRVSFVTPKQVLLSVNG